MESGDQGLSRASKDVAGSSTYVTIDPGRPLLGTWSGQSFVNVLILVDVVWDLEKNIQLRLIYSIQ